MNSSKLTSKNQATIPKEIRKKLKLKAGDQIIFEIIDNKIISIRKAEPFDLEFAKALNKTLSEWNSPEDDEAYNDL
jgi:antitoxin PrlF